MLTTLLISWIAAAPAGDVVSSHKDVTFVGFSEDENLAAWRLKVTTTRRSGVQDHYTIIRVVDTVSNLTIEVYRESGIRRTDGTRIVRIPTEYLAAANPEWGEAAPHDEWTARRKEAKFAATLVGPREAILGVVPDPGTKLKAFSQGNGFRVIGHKGRDLAYTLHVVFGETRTTLGRFRELGSKDHTLTAQVHVVKSRSGRLLAVLNTFDRSNDTLSYGKIVQVAAQPAVARTGRQLPDYTAQSMALADYLHRTAMGW